MQIQFSVWRAPIKAVLESAEQFKINLKFVFKAGGINVS